MQISTDRVFSARHRHADGTMKTSRYRIGGNGPALEWVEEPQRLNKNKAERPKRLNATEFPKLQDDLGQRDQAPGRVGLSGELLKVTVAELVG